MEALLVDHIPEGPGWQYEPKWDGFRCLVFRDHAQLELQSKAGRPLTRYFPELLKLFSGLRARRFVVDGEIVVPVDGRFSFDDLLQRIHPAASRIEKLSRQTPATFIAFDLLVDPQGKSLTHEPLPVRRRALEQFARKFFAGNSSIRLSPATTDLTQARAWLESAGGDLDGLIAKRLACHYLSGERAGMQKVKVLRTADCVVGGFRYASGEKVIGSLLLGLYNDQGLLDHVGFCSGLKRQERKNLLKQLLPLVQPPGFTGNAPGGPSRWSTERSAEWERLKPELVVEIAYDHFTGGRFRHGTRLRRWRPDKDPRACRFDQVACEGQGALQVLQG